MLICTIAVRSFNVALAFLAFSPFTFLFNCQWFYVQLQIIRQLCTKRNMKRAENIFVSWLTFSNFFFSGNKHHIHATINTTTNKRNTPTLAFAPAKYARNIRTIDTDSAQEHSPRKMLIRTHRIEYIWFAEPNFNGCRCSWMKNVENNGNHDHCFGSARECECLRYHLMNEMPVCLLWLKAIIIY